MPVQQPQDMSASDVVAANLRALKAYYHKTDEQIAAEMGQKRSWVQERVSGIRECKATDVALFASYFGVEPGVLFSQVPIILVASSCTNVVTNGQMELPLGVFPTSLHLLQGGGEAVELPHFPAAGA